MALNKWWLLATYPSVSISTVIIVFFTIACLQSIIIRAKLLQALHTHCLPFWCGTLSYKFSIKLFHKLNYSTTDNIHWHGSVWSAQYQLQHTASNTQQWNFVLHCETCSSPYILPSVCRLSLPRCWNYEQSDVTSSHAALVTSSIPTIRKEYYINTKKKKKNTWIINDDACNTEGGKITGDTPCMINKVLSWTSFTIFNNMIHTQFTKKISSAFISLKIKVLING